MAAWYRAAAAVAAVAFCVCNLDAPARADGWVDELKAGLLAHDFLHQKESGVDFNGEVLFVSPGFMRWILSPRPHIGFSVNSAGNTDQVYAGLTWTLIGKDALLVEDDRLFLNYGFGGSVNDGNLDTKRSDEKELGTRLLFRLSAEAGYTFLPHNSLSVYFDHESNAGLSAQIGRAHV